MTFSSRCITNNNNDGNITMIFISLYSERTFECHAICFDKVIETGWCNYSIQS